ncbi:hypothetical protein thsrh120_38970 [Rhizobium sp. No.120]
MHPSRCEAWFHIGGSENFAPFLLYDGRELGFVMANEFNQAVEPIDLLLNNGGIIDPLSLQMLRQSKLSRKV